MFERVSMSSLVQFEVTGGAAEGEMDKRVCEGILPPLLTPTQHDLRNFLLSSISKISFSFQR